MIDIKTSTELNFVYINELPLTTEKQDFPSTEYAIPPQYKTDNLPKITIITPSFNQGQYIEETIRSVLLQNYPNLEYIIIDGGSTDDSVIIIKKYEKWIHYWVSEPDEGQSDAINKGFAQATGDVFNWLNSDDLLAPNALWEIATHFSKDNQTSVLIGKLQVIRDNNLLKDKYGMQCLKDVESTMSFGRMSQPALFFRLEKIKILRGVDKRFHYCMDLDLWYRYLLTFGLSNIISTEQTLAYYRIHDATKSSNEKEADEERLILILTLLKALGLTKNKIKELKSLSLNIEYYNKVWDLNKSFLNKNRLFSYLIEQILVMPSFNFPLIISLKYWIISLKYQWFGRRQYFFTLPLRFIYRKWRQYRKLGKYSS
jgi:glycosyltransferase involved in cell wall biosynthesis